MHQKSIQCVKGFRLLNNSIYGLNSMSKIISYSACNNHKCFYFFHMSFRFEFKSTSITVALSLPKRFASIWNSSASCPP